MAKVIVPKNYVYTDNITVSGINTSNIIGSTYTTIFQLLPELDTGILGFNITINYGMSSSTINVPWDRGDKNITIKNSYPFGCNFIILTVNNLPKIKNTGTTDGRLALRLQLSDGRVIYLTTNTIAIGSTLTIPNQTYYVDLVNSTAVTRMDNLCNKAVTYNDSYWWAPEEIYNDNSTNTSYTITPKNPHPYIFNNIEFRGPNYSATAGGTAIIPINSSSVTRMIINIDTSNNPSYIFLELNGLPKYKNTGTSTVTIQLYVSISGTGILVNTDTLQPGFEVESGAASTICIDVVNKKLIDASILNKAITHL